MPGRGNGSAAEALTTREREVLGLVAEGLTNREIGERLSMSENAVRFYL
jgi:DNA-binding CsgD family transcriptional regulator